MKMLRVCPGSVCLALAVMVLLVLPVTTMAGGGEIKIDPKLLKKLLNKQTFKVNPGLSIEPLFTFNVPVNIKKVHKDVEKAYIWCGVSDSEEFFAPGNYGHGSTEIPLSNGAYNGNVTVRISSMDTGDPAGVSYYFCALAFKVKGGGILSLEALADSPYIYAPGTNSNIAVKGKLFP